MKECTSDHYTPVGDDMTLIAQKRKALKLQLHLASKGAKQLWDALDAQYQSIEQGFSVIMANSQTSVSGVSNSFHNKAKAFKAALTEQSKK